MHAMHKCTLETLESRRLLSATVWFEESLRLLWVIGSAEADHLNVRIESTLTRPTGNRVTISDPLALPEMVYDEWFEGESLRTVEIFGSAGNDAIEVSLAAPDVLVGISGDDGDDEIVQSTTAGSLCGPILGGAGDDIIRAVAELGAVWGYFIMGEDGDDLIYGSDMDDLIYGDIDEIREGAGTVPAGSDSIHGGRGDDVLFGGPLNDFIYGEAGNDSLIGGGDADRLDGGKGFDTAEVDDLDELIDVEIVIWVNPDAT